MKGRKWGFVQKGVFEIDCIKEQLIEKSRGKSLTEWRLIAEDVELKKGDSEWWQQIGWVCGVWVESDWIRVIMQKMRGDGVKSNFWRRQMAVWGEFRSNFTLSPCTLCEKLNIRKTMISNSVSEVHQGQMFHYCRGKRWGYKRDWVEF